MLSPETKATLAVLAWIGAIVFFGWMFAVQTWALVYILAGCLLVLLDLIIRGVWRDFRDQYREEKRRADEA
jgi:membrane protein YdbS with pleckstrin-like domain